MSLLSSDADGIDKGTKAGTDRFFREAARLAKLQRALSEVGVADAVVQLLSAARDVAARSPYQVRASEVRLRVSPNPNPSPIPNPNP